MKSEVHFTNMRTRPGYNLLDKLRKLALKAGIDKIDFKDKYVAIKIHFGEPGNLAFLRANWAKVVVDIVKERGGKPFLTDCNTLYVGRRKNALDHLESAYENGFSPFSTGCHIIIGDGLRGTEESYVPVVGGELVKEAKIGSAIMEADIFISLTHFKGHEATGFGGALKNIGMGCGSRAGKMEQHNSGKPDVNKEACTGCELCSKYCAHNAISYDENGMASINHDKCVGCGRCLSACNFDAIYNENSSANDDLNMKIAEYSKAVLDGRPNFHISVVNQVSPYCDCHSENDVAMIPDVGIFASFDPVALDVACADKCNEMPVLDGTHLYEQIHVHNSNHNDHFQNSMPETNWRVCVEHAEKLGIGIQQYNLIEME